MPLCTLDRGGASILGKTKESEGIKYGGGIWLEAEITGLTGGITIGLGRTTN